MKLASMSDIPCTPCEEQRIAAAYLQGICRAQQVTSQQERSLREFLDSLQPELAREVAIEVLLQC